MASSNNINYKMTLDISQLTSAANKAMSTFGKLGQSANGLSSKMSRISKNSNLVKTALGGITGIAIGKYLADATKSAIDYVEAMNLFKVTTAGATDELTSYIDKISEMYGLDPMPLMNAIGMFQQLNTAAGLTADTASIMSQGLTTMAVDMASLFNMDFETVLNNLTSGMMGMSMAVKKYGIDIRSATLQQVALQYGITESVEEMNEANRKALRYIAIMQQAGVASGDFARTIESPANQLRILGQQAINVARAIGTFFVNALASVLPYINAVVMAISAVLGFFAALFGFEIPDFSGAVSGGGGISDVASGFDDAAGSIGDAGSAADKTKKKIDDLLAPFDELNILQEESASASGIGGGGGGGGGGGLGGFGQLDPALEEAIKNLRNEMEDVNMKAVELRDKLLNFFGFKWEDVIDPETGELERKLVWVSDLFRKNLIDKFPQWKKTINAVFDNWDEIIDAFARLGSVLWETIKTPFGMIRDFLANLFKDVDWDAAIAQFIEDLPERLNAISDWIEEHQETIGKLILVVSGVALAFQGWTAIQPVIAAVSGPLATIAGIISAVAGAVAAANPVVATIVGVIAALGAALVVAYQNFEDVRDAVQDLQDKFWETCDIIGDAWESLWNNVLAPIIELIKQYIRELWENHLKELVHQVGLAVTDIGDFLLTLIQFFSNVVDFVSKTFGPDIVSAFQLIGDIGSAVWGAIIDIVTGAIEVFRGIIEFLTGVFSGDWEKAWEGVKTIFKGVWDAFSGIVKGVFNAVISLINSVLRKIFSAISKTIGAITSVIEAAGDVIGVDINFGNVGNAPQIPYLAHGGIVREDTIARIGEGRYKEAVIPLGNSPEMQQLIQQLAAATGGGGETIVKVYIGDKEWDAFTYKSAKRGEKLVGPQPVRVGG